MSDQLTPMMAQYRRLRAELPPDTLLFFRLGDFYEMFFDDAVRASQVLDLALTKRQQVPMCGVPYHAAEGYLAKLIRAGLKVAICDQLEEASAARGLVRRDITRIVTPGTVLESGLLDASQNNYLAAVCRLDRRLGLAALDLSTGAFWIEEPENEAALGDLLAKLQPSECVVPEEQRGAWEAVLRPGGGGPLLSVLDDWKFQLDSASDALRRHFAVHSLDGFGCAGLTAAVGAAGALLLYVTQDLRRNGAHIRGLAVRQAGDFMHLDEATVANLELVSGRAGGGASLLRVLDATRTAMGGRLLRDWLLRPLTGREAILRRQDAVAALTADGARLRALREALGAVRDLERLVARLSAGAGNARDVRAVAQSLEALPAVRAAAEGGPAARLRELAEDLQPLPELRDLIERAIVEEPPLPLKEGGLIRSGYHAELDELREAAGKGHRWLAEYQATEQQRTGIKSLKVRYNKVFGYYIEVTKANLDQVPETYIRKQTIVNGERFITPELKDYETRIVGAQDRARALEYELFLEVRAAVVRETGLLQRNAAALAALDVLAALADRAGALRYVRPELTEGDALVIRGGRHPVIEQLPDAERFVTNDTRLDNRENQILMITGPNMAGKSTYLRQVALIVILAQIGSFVPADAAELGVCDRVFTRVGASDDLARGRSTFLVEMQETANILRHATPRSLIVLDEIGRGTSTFDGISIAWAVAEHLHNTPAVKAKTLFATHYHELTDLALTMGGIKNYNVLVRESGDRVVFLRRIVAGAAEKSFGIHVARLAGLPDEVVERAHEVLANLEEGEFGEAGQPKLARRRVRRPARADDASQLSLF